MAERYGEVPEKFTKAWWEYFWEYYRWYVIVPIIIVIAIGSTIYSKLTEEKHDLTVMYAADNIIMEDKEDELVSKLSELCEDFDENGEKSLSLSQLWITSEPEQADMEYVRAMATKLQLSFSENDKFVYIMDKEAAELYFGESKEECPFAPIDVWAENIPENEKLLSAHGVSYGISLADNKLLDGYGIDLSDHYILMRYYPNERQLEKQQKGYESAAVFSNRLLESK